MSIFQLGFIIKRRREELGCTQEELADGICSVPTLSRIENGERMPTKEHLEMLLQRLGYSDTMLDAYIDEKTFRLHELKFKIRQATILGKLDEAKTLLSEYEQIADKESPIARQFILLFRLLVYPRDHSMEYRLEQFETAIRMTCPKYESSKLPMILSYEEILIACNIAICHFELGQADTAINILYAIKQYYENHIISSEEILRTQPMVLYDLSKFLGCAKRYDECIEICDLGIRIARETGRCTQLDKMFYNRAWALVRRGGAQDFAEARESAQLAVHMADAMGQTVYKKFYLDFIRETFQTDAQ